MWGSGKGWAVFALLLLLHGVTAFLPPSTRLVGLPRATSRREVARQRSSARCKIVCFLSQGDKHVINEQFEELLRGKDTLKLLDVLRKHKHEIDLDWPKASILLDRIADTNRFRAQVEEMIAEQGGENEINTMMNPNNPLLAFQRYQKEQLEATSLVYEVLKEKKLLRGFSCLQDVKAYNDAYLPKPVTPADIQAKSSLPMTALSPGTSQFLWIWAGGLICVAELLICAYLGVDAGAVIPATVLGFFVDRFFLGGRIFDQFARIFLPRYKERIVRHEAGHFLMAYLLGCPVQGCILRPVWNGAIFGEAGTVFLDKKLFDELDRSRISASSVDRYTTVVMAGIAAEALTFDNAEGGGSDEQSILLLLSLMNPPWDFERITSQARWGALRALLVLKDYRAAYESLVEALSRGDSLGSCIKVIEDALATRDELVPSSAIVEPVRAVAAPSTSFDDIRRVLMPADGSSPSRADVPEEVRAAMENMRKAAEQDIKPSFEGADAIRLKEETERLDMAAEERKLEARMRDLEKRLQRVNAKIEGKPATAAGEQQEAAESDSAAVDDNEPSPDDSLINEQLKSVDDRLKQLKALLGE